MYWDLVYAYENVRVQQEALTLHAEGALKMPSARHKLEPCLPFRS